MATALPAGGHLVFGRARTRPANVLARGGFRLTTSFAMPKIYVYETGAWCAGLSCRPQALAPPEQKRKAAVETIVLTGV
jgi:hypothetical protein